MRRWAANYAKLSPRCRARITGAAPAGSSHAGTSVGGPCHPGGACRRCRCQGGVRWPQGLGPALCELRPPTVQRPGLRVWFARHGTQIVLCRAG